MPSPYSYLSYFSSSPSLPGAWSSAWSLPQQYREYQVAEKALEVAETKCDDDHGPLSSSISVDLDCPEYTDTVPFSNHMPISWCKTDPLGALFTSRHQEDSNSQSLESQYIPVSPQDDAIGRNTFPGKYSPPCSCPSFCSSRKSTPIAFESNASLETLSLSRESVSNSPINSPSSQTYSFSLEPEDINQETIHSCSSLRKPTGITRPSFDTNTLLGDFDTYLDKPHKTDFIKHIPRDLDPGQNHSSDFYPYPLLLSQPDGNNTWTLSLNPTISRPETISESSLELESLSLSCTSDHDDEAIARIRGIAPSVYSIPRYDDSCLSLPPLQVEFSATSDMSMIASSTASVRPHGEGTISVPPSTGNADSYSNNLPQDLPLSTVQKDLQQPTRSKKLVKKSKDLFGRLKRLLTPKGTISEDIQASAAHPPKSILAENLSSPIGFNTQADTIPQASGRRFLPSPPWPSYQRHKLPRPRKYSTPSLGQSSSHEGTSHTGSNIDEKYTYEYHARPKTLKEIKSQRRFSLPMAFVGTSSRATSSTKRNITVSVPPVEG